MPVDTFLKYSQYNCYYNIQYYLLCIFCFKGTKNQFRLEAGIDAINPFDFLINNQQSREILTQKQQLQRQQKPVKSIVKEVKEPGKEVGKREAEEQEMEDPKKTLEVIAPTCLPDAFDLWKEKYRYLLVQLYNYIKYKTMLSRNFIKPCRNTFRLCF